MSKYIVSIILASSVLTGINVIPGITSNFTAQEQLQFDQQKSWELIAQGDEPEDKEEDETLTPGEERRNKE